MTRKKYSKDTTQEEIDRWAAELYETSSDEEDEEYIPDPDEIWEDIHWYYDDNLKHSRHQWIRDWIDADFFMVDDIPDFEDDFYAVAKHYSMPSETYEVFSELYSHVYNILNICKGFKKKPEYPKVDTMVIRLLRERTKYFYIGNNVNHKSIVNKKFFKQLARC